MTNAEFESWMTCADPEPECMRSHPHENMDAGCEAKTTYARARNAAAAETGTRTILAIDPGTTESGWCLYHTERGILDSGVKPNDLMLMEIGYMPTDVLALEMVASYGMPVGREVFETVRWIGRFQQKYRRPEEVHLVYRKDVKLHLCGSPRAKDQNIRQALIDLIGPQGTKKQPGPTFGVKAHAWAALGVAVTAAHQLTTETE